MIIHFYIAIQVLLYVTICLSYRFAAYPKGVHFKVFMCTDLKKIALVVQNAGHGMNINVITLLLE
jgi:hypothetical protein